MATSYDGHATKRFKFDSENHGIQSGQRDDRHKPQPSPVLHVRGLTDYVTQSDLIDAVQKYGSVSYVMMMPRKKQALLEFDDIQCARNCVECTNNDPVHINGALVYFNYSTSQKIQRSHQEELPNSVLLFTVLNPQYPITVDVMHTICSSSGQVLRIVIFKKNGVQAMVEFDSVESAVQAKESLNGADIYSGCCTLKIEFAKPTRLNVVRNDMDSWDYTNPNLGGGKEPTKNAPLLADPRFSSGPTPYAPGDPRNNRNDGNHGYPAHDYTTSESAYNAEHYGRPERYAAPSHSAHSGFPRMKADSSGYEGYPPQQYDRYGTGPPRGLAPAPYPHHQGELSSDSASMLQQGCVLMVYGLNMDKMNCKRLFNLFCLYGNVVRVKFLKSKEGSAMIQMGDGSACERAMQNLNNLYFFGNKLQLGFSKQAFLQDVPNPHELKDGTASFIDFMGNRNNRFTTPEAAQKNRIQPPTAVLHYFNAPPSLTEEQLTKVFEELYVKPPPRMKKFPSKSERSSTGLLEWDSKADSTEALVIGNHAEIPNPTGKHPYIMKLCYSSSPISYASATTA